MRILLVSAFLFFSQLLLSGQGITDSVIDSLYRYNYLEARKLSAVRTINYGLKLVENLDTIAYFIGKEGLVYTHRGKVLHSPFSRILENQPVGIRFWYGHGRETVEIRFVNVINDKKREAVVRYISNQVYTKYIVENYTNEIHDGCYLELTPYGEKLVEGNYQQIDTIWQDTLTVVDPMTYEVRDSLLLRSARPLKVGQWIYRNKRSDILRIEEYPKID